MNESAAMTGIAKREETRRSLLAKAGIVGGAVGLASLAHVERAFATTPNLDPLTVSDVRTWGAVGDGSHDDTTAIQNAINDSQGRAAVYFPPGTWKVTAAPLTLPSNTVLIGHGALSIIKAIPVGSSEVIGNSFLNGSLVNDVRIENLTIDANFAIRTAGIKIVGTLSPWTPARRVFIRGVELKNLKLSGPNIPPDDNNPFAGIQLNTIEFGAVENCHVHTTHRTGIYAQNVSSFTVSNNLVENCSDDHIDASGADPSASLPVSALAGVVIEGNVVNAGTATRGCAIRPGWRASVIGNVCYGGVHAGIEVRGNTHDVLIVGNTVLEAGNTDGSERNEATSFGDPKGNGISVFNRNAGAYVGQINRVNITGNFIYASRSHGVALISSGSDQSGGGSITDVGISGNLIWCGPPVQGEEQPDGSLVPSGVAVTGVGGINSTPAAKVSNVGVTNNEIRLSPGPGVAVRGSNCARFDIRDNSILDCGTTSANQPGILIDGFSGFLVLGNRSQETRSSNQTQSYGLSATNVPSGGKSLVMGNDFSGNLSGGSIPSSDQGGVFLRNNLGVDL